MSAPGAFSSRLEAALALAARAHSAQVRKGTDVPYIVHPVHVAVLLMRYGFDEDLAVAGLLHDTVEDSGVTIDQVRDAFGEAVAHLVAAVTERKLDGDVKRPWRTRKEEQLAELAHAGPEVAALKAADALHNVSCTLVDAGRMGRAAWDRFNAPAEDSLWYYGEVARLCRERLGDHPLARELADAVSALAATSRRP